MRTLFSFCLLFLCTYVSAQVIPKEELHAHSKKPDAPFEKWKLEISEFKTNHKKISTLLDLSSSSETNHDIKKSEVSAIIDHLFDNAGKTSEFEYQSKDKLITFKGELKVEDLTAMATEDPAKLFLLDFTGTAYQTGTDSKSEYKLQYKIFISVNGSNNPGMNKVSAVVYWRSELGSMFQEGRDIYQFNRQANSLMSNADNMFCETIAVYPQSVTNRSVNITFNGQDASRLSVTLVTSYGAVVHQADFTQSQVRNIKYNIPESLNLKGSYFIRVTNQETKATCAKAIFIQ